MAVPEKLPGHHAASEQSGRKPDNSPAQFCNRLIYRVFNAGTGIASHPYDET
jgi:hypothetical protein